MKNKSQKISLIPIILCMVVLGLAVLAWRKGGAGLVGEGFLSGGTILVKEIPLLIAAFLTAGLLQALVKKETIQAWLGAESGWRGLALACIAGALIPGGPYAYYPIAGALLHSGAGLGVLVSFVTAKNLWSISRLPMEFALLGADITITRYAITFIFPPLIGFLAEHFLGHTLDAVRGGVQK